MKSLGIDIGTSTLSAVIMEDGNVLASETVANGADLPSGNAWEHLQDPDVILAGVTAVARRLLDAHPDTACIGFTGQMHGMVYLDKNGNAVSPLATWQDGRGNRPLPGGGTAAEELSALTGYPMATGYGLTTHYYNLKHSLVPQEAVTFCTIHDYAAMKFAGLTSPRMDASDAASFGLFDVQRGEFDLAALKKAGMDASLLPPVTREAFLGVGPFGLPVYTAIGDNQASFLGSVSGRKNCILINAGTGGQFSAHTEEYLSCAGLEARPYPAGGYLMVGSLLCGGSAYAYLEKFFRATVEAMTGEKMPSCYAAMAKLAEEGLPEDAPEFVPLFRGTRQEPQTRAEITALNPDNFTPRHLLAALLRGMAKEYASYASCYFAAGGKAGALIGSGNGIRKNPALVQCMEDAFGMPLEVSSREEEAACGAALWAAGNVC